MSDAAEAAFVEGLKALEKQQLNRALEKFTRAYVLNPKEPRYQGYRAWAQYYVVDEGDEAIRLELTEQCHQELEEAVANCPDHDPLHVLLGTVYLTENRPQQAVTVFERALALNSENSGAAIGLKTAHKKLRGSVIHNADLGHLKVVEPLEPETQERASASDLGNLSNLKIDNKATIPSPPSFESKPPQASRNRNDTTTASASSVSRTEISKSGNVFSTVRLRSEIDGLKRARERDLSTFHERESKQAEELSTLRDHYEKNISHLEETIEKLSAEKSAIAKDFELSKDYFEQEKKKISLLLAEHESTSSALKLSHDEIRAQVDLARAESLDADQRLVQQREHLEAEQGQLQSQLETSQNKLDELEYALSAERKMLEVSDQSNEELISEFEQARLRYEKEIISLRDEKTSLLIAKDEEQNEFSKRISELESELAQTKKERDELNSKNELEQLQQILSKSEEDLEEAIVSFEESNAARIELQKELTEKNLELDIVREELARADQNAIEQAAAYNRLTEQHNQDKEVIEGLAEAQQRNIDLVQMVEKLEYQLDDIQNEKIRLSNEVEASAAEVEFLRGQRKESETSLNEFETLKTFLQQRENELEKSKQDNETLSESITKQGQKILEIQALFEQRNQEVIELRESLSQRGTLEDYHNLEEQVLERQLRLEEEESKSHILKSHISERNEKLENQEIQLSTQRIELASLQRANQELSQLQISKDKTIRNLQDELELLEQTFRNLPSSDEYIELKRKVSEQAEELASYDDIRTSLQSEISSITTEQTTRIQKLVAENQELVGQLQDMAALQSREHEHTVQTEDALRSAKQNVRELEKKNIRLQTELEELAEKNRVLPSADDFSRITELLNERDKLVSDQENTVKSLEDKLAHQKESYEAKVTEFVNQIHEQKTAREQDRSNFEDELNAERKKELSIRRDYERLQLELTELRSATDTQISQLKRQQEDDIDKLNLAHGEEMQLLQVQNESHLKRIQVELGRYQDAVQLKTSLEKKFEEFTVEHASQLDSIEEEHRTHIKELEGEWTDKLNLAEAETQRLRDEIATVLSENAEIQESLASERGKSAESLSARQEQDAKYAQTARELASVLDTVQEQIEQQKQVTDRLREEHRKELELVEEEKVALVQTIKARDEVVLQAEEDARELRAKFRRAQEQIAVLLEQQIELRQSSISMIESADSASDDRESEVGSMDILDELSEDNIFQETSDDSEVDEESLVQDASEQEDSNYQEDKG
ncbi:MAG: hypothetical protein VYC39_10665 [Myxococcota bacterium]|nr:hypothetical protein [Myxococcota bacterium]